MNIDTKPLSKEKCELLAAGSISAAIDALINASDALRRFPDYKNFLDRFRAIRLELYNHMDFLTESESPRSYDSYIS